MILARITAQWGDDWKPWVATLTEQATARMLRCSCVARSQMVLITILRHPTPLGSHNTYYPAGADCFWCGLASTIQSTPKPRCGFGGSSWENGAKDAGARSLSQSQTPSATGVSPRECSALDPVHMVLVNLQLGISLATWC